MKRPSAAKAAADILRETDNPSISCRDHRLIHLVADRIGISSNGPSTSKSVVAAIARSNQGDLLIDYVVEKVVVRRWWLPEYAPARVVKASKAVAEGGGGAVDSEIS